MFHTELGVRSATVLVVTSLLLVACSGGTPSASSAAKQSGAEPSKPVHEVDKVSTVLISQFKYQPDTITVNVGETVEWKNADIVPHTATAADGKAFDSGSIAKGASWSFRAAKRGTYDYLCTLHPNMKARLVVQ